jgi:hypothetical protein
MFKLVKLAIRCHCGSEMELSSEGVFSNYWICQCGDYYIEDK